MAERTPSDKADRAYHVRIQAPAQESFRDLPFSRMDIGCTGGIREQLDGSFALDAYVTEAVMEEIRKGPFKVDVIADALDELKRAQAQVGKGNRFKGENRLPRGLGKKTRRRE
jgi:hypothetical protein